MSYVTAIAALRTRLATVSGIKVVVNGLPSSAHNLPLIFLEADNGTHRVEHQVAVNVYRVTATVCVNWQGNHLAEDELAPYINSVPVALETDPTLGGVVNGANAMEWRASGPDGYPVIADVKCRAVVWTIQVVDKPAAATAVRGGP